MLSYFVRIAQGKQYGDKINRDVILSGVSRDTADTADTADGIVVDMM